MSEQEETQSSGAGGRGASYPFIDLQEAIGRARKLFEEDGKAMVAVPVAVKHWGYSEKSSGAKQTISTMLQYGLLRDEGGGAQRKVGLSKLALDIVLHEADSPEQIAAIQAAARSPKLFSDIFSRYETLPSDSTLKHYLVTERNINSAVVDNVVKNLRTTVRYAKLDSSAKIPDAGAKTGVNKEKQPPKVGDLIQWESGGVLQFAEPRAVRAVQEHDGSLWVFVDGSDTGIPVAEVTVEQATTAPAVNPPKLPFPAAEVKLPSESEWLKGRLSKDGATTFRLFGTGEFGPKEIGSLIRLLKAQKAILSGEEEEDAE